MSTKTTQLDWREGRRQRAWELKQQGWKQQDIAAALGVTPGAVSQWLKRGREQGVEALRRHPVPGPSPKLSAAQVAQLPALLERGAEAYGFRGQVWTCRRVAEVIRRTFGVTYHPAHVSRLLHAVRQSVQRPRVRAAQRDQAAITAWWRERWPALEKKPPKKVGPSSG
jgi:transposase